MHQGAGETFQEGVAAVLVHTRKVTFCVIPFIYEIFRIRKSIETEAVTDFLGSQITSDSDCSHEIKRRSLEGKL